MIGVKKNIIVVAAGPFQFAMVNPVIMKNSGKYQTEEGCLSLEGVRSCTRYQEIEVDYLNQIAELDTAASSFFSHQYPDMVEWFAKMVEERKENHRSEKEKKNW